MPNLNLYKMDKIQIPNSKDQLLIAGEDYGQQWVYDYFEAVLREKHFAFFMILTGQKSSRL